MKKVIITGATKGIGLELLNVFIEAGHEVIGTYSKGEAKAQELINKFGSTKLKFYPLDLSKTSSLNDFLKILPNNIDVLVNNAGLGSKTVENYSPDKFEQDELLLKVNALGPLWLTQSLIEKNDKQRNLKIINISSVGGGIFHFSGFRLADGMSKAALTFMAKQMAAEHVHTNVDIYTVCPGATETDMFHASTLSKMNESERAQFESKLPKKRLIAPREIADVCFFLASQKANVLHGAVIDASMGLGVNPGLVQN